MAFWAAVTQMEAIIAPVLVSFGLRRAATGGALEPGCRQFALEFLIGVAVVSSSRALPAR